MRAPRRIQGGAMKTCSLTAVAAMLGLVFVASPVATAQATELQILAGGGMTAALRELGAQFESTSGHKLVFRFGTTPELIKMATAGALFDLGVVPREFFEGRQGAVRAWARD